MESDPVYHLRQNSSSINASVTHHPRIARSKTEQSPAPKARVNGISMRNFAAEDVVLAPAAPALDADIVPVVEVTGAVDE